VKVPAEHGLLVGEIVAITTSCTWNCHTTHSRI